MGCGNEMVVFMMSWVMVSHPRCLWELDADSFTVSVVLSSITPWRVHGVRSCPLIDTSGQSLASTVSMLASDGGAGVWLGTENARPIA